MFNGQIRNKMESWKFDNPKHIDYIWIDLYLVDGLLTKTLWLFGPLNPPVACKANCIVFILWIATRQNWPMTDGQTF